MCIRDRFSAVLKVGDAARMHAEWTTDGISERFRGYVYLKGQGR